MSERTNFNWKSGLFLIIYQALLLATLPLYFLFYTPTVGTLALTLFFLTMGGLSITAGYHRLFAHKSFKTRPLIEGLLLFFGSSTFQGSALRWAYDHRNHHAYVDTERDPYSITKGFWHAHFFWLLKNLPAIEPKVVSDLLNNRRIAWQHRNDLLCMIGSNALITLFSGAVTGDWMGSFMLTLWLRIFIQHHTTWFINSLAHTWGDQPFCKEHSAVNNYIISLLTYGEGYHNYHHTFASDYRNGVRWYQFDPTKWIIWTLAKCGLAWGLRRVDIHTIEKKIVLERKKLLLVRTKELWYVKKEELELKIQELSDELVGNIMRFKELSESYCAMRRERADSEALKAIKGEIQSLKSLLRREWRDWKRLSNSIMQLNPLVV